LYPRPRGSFVRGSLQQQPAATFSNSLLKNLEFVIPNGVCEVRNLSFLGILIEEGFLASLGMTAKRIFQQPPKPVGQASS